MPLQLSKDRLQEDIRRSDRISLVVPIEVSGTDVTGTAFTERTRTLVISRHGGKIILKRSLAPQQELLVRCLTTGREAGARVMGQAGISAEEYSYGIEVLNPEDNVWAISFPPRTESAEAAGRVLIECMACHRREVAPLTDPELEVYWTTKRLSRTCATCKQATLWSEAAHDIPPKTRRDSPPAPPEESAPESARQAVPRTTNERRSPRLTMKIAACARTPQLGEEVTRTENVSSGGFCFKSRKNYAQEWLIETAVPYGRRGVNIFVPARIAWTQHVPGKGMMLYGIAYLKPAGEL